MRNRLAAMTAASAIGYLAGFTPAASDVAISVQGDEVPKLAPWTQPAAFNYTIDNNGDDSYAIDVAARIDTPVGQSSDNTVFARVVVHANNLISKRQEFYSVEAGFHYEGDSAPEGTTDPKILAEAWYWAADFSLAYNSRAVYPLASPSCMLDPSNPVCDTQYQRSLRLAATVQPFSPAWEDVPFLNGEGRVDGPAIAYSFAPAVSLFYDHVTESVVDPVSGRHATGDVAGARILAGGMIAPRMFDYRLVFRVSAQLVQAFSRSDDREASFPESSGLVRLSLDYELGHQSIIPGPGWAPSIGISYVNGRDPLAGLPEQDNFVIGFRLTYKTT
jgi:hypothetical protein